MREEVRDSPVSGTAGSWQLHSGHPAAAAKPFGKAGGASVKASLRKNRKRCAERGSGGRKGEKQEGAPGPERDEKVHSMSGPCRPWKTRAKAKGNCGKPRPELISPKNCSRWESHARAEEKYELLHADCTCPQFSLCWSGREESGIKRSLDKEGRKVVLLTCVFTLSLLKLAVSFLF